jgi:signal transduction histidine kinase
MDFKRVLILTLAVWLATIAAFGAGMGIIVGHVPAPWVWAWLTALIVPGTVLGLGLYAAIDRLEALSLAARWRRLALPFFLIVAVQAALDHFLYGLMRAWMGPGPTEGFLQGFAFDAVLYIWLFGFQALVFELLVATDRAARNARNAAEAREAARAAQLQALRTELNPHMLFNTFNGLSALVLAGRNSEAETLLERLSTYMRACLDGSDEALIPLGEEIELIRAYLEIEAVRFASTPDVRIEVPEDLAESRAPRLILQPLIENALKYAVHPSQGTAVVRVSAGREGGRLRLTVEDTGPGGPVAAASGTGRGLSIVARRLRTLFGEDAEMRAGPAGDGFRVDLLMPRLEAAPAVG